MKKGEKGALSKCSWNKILIYHATLPYSMSDIKYTYDCNLDQHIDYSAGRFHMVYNHPPPPEPLPPSPKPHYFINCQNLIFILWIILILVENDIQNWSSTNNRKLFTCIDVYWVFFILCKNDRRYVLPEYEKKPDQ